jgi:hypothetical protein
MARGKGKGGNAGTPETGAGRKRAIERYEHADKQRVNNPPMGLVTPETDPLASSRKTYEHFPAVPSVKPGQDLDYDPHLDPQLVWAGKKEHTPFEVPTVSLHVHERIDPRTIVEAVRKRNGNGQPVQPSLFERPEETLPLRDAIDFYRHAHGWSNRMIAGDSLLSSARKYAAHRAVSDMFRTAGSLSPARLTSIPLVLIPLALWLHRSMSHRPQASTALAHKCSRGPGARLPPAPPSTPSQTAANLNTVTKPGGTASSPKAPFPCVHKSFRMNTSIHFRISLILKPLEKL